VISTPVRPFPGTPGYETLTQIGGPLYQLPEILQSQFSPVRLTGTGGIERFSARKNLSKILQVGHFHLGFSPGKINNEMIHSHRVLLEIVDP